MLTYISYQHTSQRTIPSYNLSSLLTFSFLCASNNSIRTVFNNDTEASDTFMNSSQTASQPPAKTSGSNLPAIAQDDSGTPSLAMLLSTLPEDIASLMEVILTRLAAASFSVQPETDLDLERCISEALLRLGMPAHMQGYRFVRLAITIAVQDPAATGCLSRDMYPRIAEQCVTTVSRVERSIRHAIAAAWDKTGAAGVNQVLGRCAFDASMRPTNREFVTLLAERIRLGAQR